MCLMCAASRFHVSSENTIPQKDIWFDYQVSKVKIGKTSIFTVNMGDAEIAVLSTGRMDIFS